MAEEINKTYTSNSLYNDSTGVIAFAEQLKQELINWANYQHVTEELGQNRPDLQNELNNLFLSVYERFLTFLNDADASEEAINTWKEIENFLADYTDEKTLASIVAELNNKIESRLTVPLESTTGSSTTSTMTQKAITETIDASKTFTTGEKVDNVGIDDGVKYKSENLAKSGSVVDTWLAQKGIPSNQPIFDVIEEFGYFPSDSITPVHFESATNQISALLFEFNNIDTEEIYINAINKTILGYCHFLNTDKNIMSGYSIIGGSSDVIGTVTKPQGAKYIAITNYMSVILFPYVTGTKNFSVLRDDFYSLQGSFEKSAEFNGNTPYCYLPSNSLVPVSYYSENSKVGVRLFKFKNTNEEKIFLGIINVSNLAYTHFLDSNKNIIQGSSIQGVTQQYRYKGIITKPQGAQYIAISNDYNYCPQPFVSGTTEYNDSLLYNIPYSFNSIFDVTENSYFGENSIVPVSFASTQKMGTFIAEFQNTDEEDIYINAFNLSLVAYCHFLDSNKNIISGSSIVGALTNTDVIGNVTKPQGAKYIAITNYFALCPYPYVTKTVSLLNRLDTIQEKIDSREIYPYIFNIDFVKNIIETSIITGSYTLSENGATISTGYSNRLNITRWASADNCSVYADILLVNSNSKICLSTIDDVHSSATSGHGSFVVFNFEDSKIQVYPRTTGDEVPQTPLQELFLDNISGLEYKIEIGRKDRQLYAALTNNKTCVRKEIVITEPTTYTSSTETDPAGWMKDTPCISLLSGSCYIRRITGIVKQSQIIFLGDSITEGLKNEYNKCWCKMVMEELGDGTNFADSGRQIDYCQRVVDSILPLMNAKFVVVTIGTNGGNTAQNLSTLRDSIMKLGAIPIFNHIPMGSSAINVNSMIDSLKCDGSLLDVATATNNVPSDGQNSSLFIDGVHPNVTGNQKMYERFITDLKYLLYRKLT